MIGVDPYIYQQFLSIWRDVVIAHVSTNYAHVYDY